MEGSSFFEGPYRELLPELIPFLVCPLAYHLYLCSFYRNLFYPHDFWPRFGQNDLVINFIAFWDFFLSFLGQFDQVFQIVRQRSI